MTAATKFENWVREHAPVPLRGYRYILDPQYVPDDLPVLLRLSSVFVRYVNEGDLPPMSCLHLEAKINDADKPRVMVGFYATKGALGYNFSNFPDGTTKDIQDADMVIKFIDDLVSLEEQGKLTAED